MPFRPGDVLTPFPLGEVLAPFPPGEVLTPFPLGDVLAGGHSCGLLDRLCRHHSWEWEHSWKWEHFLGVGAGEERRLPSLDPAGDPELLNGFRADFVVDAAMLGTLLFSTAGMASVPCCVLTSGMTLARLGPRWSLWPTFDGKESESTSFTGVGSFPCHGKERKLISLISGLGRMTTFSFG